MHKEDINELVDNDEKPTTEELLENSGSQARER